MKKTIGIILFIILSVSAVWIFINSSSAPTDPAPPTVSSFETIKQINYSFTIQNKTNQLFKESNLWVYAPVEKNSFQSCSEIESNFNFQQIIQNNGNQILQFPIKDLPPYASRMIQIHTQITYKSLPVPKELPNEHLYLSPEPLIESNHPEMVLLAKKLKAKNPFETAQKIYDWVSSNIEYTGYIKNSRGALYALNKRKGDCTEFMSLFVSLCRANNIPARGIGGYNCPGNCKLSTGTYHNWAEFYVDNAWLLADCQKKVFNRNASDYIAMQIISHDTTNPMKTYNRFYIQGSGLKIKMN